MGLPLMMRGIIFVGINPVQHKINFVIKKKMLQISQQTPLAAAPTDKQRMMMHEATLQCV